MVLNSSQSKLIAALAIFLFGFSNLALAANSQLTNISFRSITGDKVQVKISFSGQAVEPGSFTINNPARIALDFPNTSSGLGWKNKNIGIGFAKSITAVQAGNRTRVILNLVQLVPFETSIDGRNVIITLAGSRAASSIPNAAKSQASTVVPGDDAVFLIKNIDFRRGSKGEGRVVVTLSDSNIPASTGETGRQIFVDFGNATVAQELQQRLDVTDFATPVAFIDTTRSGNRVRLAITALGEYEYLAYQSGNVYTVEVKKPEKVVDEETIKEGDKFSGERLSLNFQDIEVRAVLDLIADITRLNMVASDSVKGNVTLRLNNVPWDQALDIVLKSKGLDMRRNGNVILVAPAQEIATREKAELEARKQIEKLEPLRSELIQVNYAKATDMATLIKSQKDSILSDRGSASVDQRTNTIIAIDTADRLEEMRKLVAKLDVPVRQVLIDSRIVIANNTFARDLGVRWGATAINPHRIRSSTSATIADADNAIINQDVVQPNLNVALPASPAAGAPGRIAFAVLGQKALIDLELSALQTEGRGEIISNPRVITSDQQKATIKQGREIAYAEASSSGAAAVSFKEAVLSLDVTPQITPDDNIFLDLQVNQDDLSGEIFAGVPAITTKEVSTKVLVANGDTIVLGGVYVERNVDSITRVPFFGDIPFLGVFFRNTNTQDSKEELLIFVTPKIVKENLKAK
ncbi:MAG: type IV pilus secretin PilQ [Gammaproteobacteria bacterium]|nr:type IV pilus secretin PilQ [Gammaproteobacteria bacterium]MDH5801739.1 type IV pilus secretin PilQ [Gammaproteobacteria bacterium]